MIGFSVWELRACWLVLRLRPARFARRPRLRPRLTASLASNLRSNSLNRVSLTRSLHWLNPLLTALSGQSNFWRSITCRVASTSSTTELRSAGSAQGQPHYLREKYPKNQESGGFSKHYHQSFGS